jgi:hypothetical protein
MIRLFPTQAAIGALKDACFMRAYIDYLGFSGIRRDSHYVEMRMFGRERHFLPRPSAVVATKEAGVRA